MILLILAAGLGVYLVLLGGLLMLMFQPPLRFAGAAARIPGPFFMILPFKSFWLFAREGPLKVGDMAPEFHLATADQKSSVRLSSYRGRQPVVMVFGSYT